MFPRRLGVAGDCIAEVEIVATRRAPPLPLVVLDHKRVRLLNVPQKNYSGGLLLV